MQTVTKEFQDHIAILRLNSGPANPISSKMVDELSEALVSLKGTARGMALCGGDQFFSAGFDLPEVDGIVGQLCRLRAGGVIIATERPADSGHQRGHIEKGNS